jgi:hypothetical protein
MRGAPMVRCVFSSRVNPRLPPSLPRGQLRTDNNVDIRHGTCSGNPSFILSQGRSSVFGLLLTRWFPALGIRALPRPIIICRNFNISPRTSSSDQTLSPAVANGTASIRRSKSTRERSKVSVILVSAQIFTNKIPSSAIVYRKEGRINDTVGCAIQCQDTINIQGIERHYRYMH